MHYVTFALLFVSWAGLFFEYIFFNNKRPKSFFRFYFGRLLMPFHTKSELNNPQAEGNVSICAFKVITHLVLSKCMLRKCKKSNLIKARQVYLYSTFHTQW